MIQIFARSWYDEAGRPSVGRKTIIDHVRTEEEARNICKAFNEGKRTSRQIKRGYKYEYTRV